ncbi:MAG: hypothetical protein CME71_07240 [Halobacteriovorax sp.]|nr:hypothetical protein [Halobacteriovorax sp.]
MKKHLRNESGQSTIEFIFSFGFAFFLIIYTLKVALNYTTGYLVHYSTYMASRAYLTFEDSGGAGSSFTSVVEPEFSNTKVGLYNKQLNIDSSTLLIKNDPQGKGILRGVTFDWETTFSSVGLFGGSETLHMKSESFIGREPDRKECSARTCKAALADDSGSCGKAFTLVDNGC